MNNYEDISTKDTEWIKEWQKSWDEIHKHSDDILKDVFGSGEARSVDDVVEALRKKNISEERIQSHKDVLIEFYMINSKIVLSDKEDKYVRAPEDYKVNIINI
jgi:hypothetical protein